jgi:hypothetical protein
MLKYDPISGGRKLVMYHRSGERICTAGSATNADTWILAEMAVEAKFSVEGQFKSVLYV